jgi:hypothetical protein
MIDAMYASLVKELPSKTRISLTADHGMVSATKKIIIGIDNPLAEGISVIAGEPRARHLYLDSSRDSKAARDEVATQWREFLKDDAQVKMGTHYQYWLHGRQFGANWRLGLRGL